MRINIYDGTDTIEITDAIRKVIANSKYTVGDYRLSNKTITVLGAKMRKPVADTGGQFGRNLPAEEWVGFYGLINSVLNKRNVDADVMSGEIYGRKRRRQRVTFNWTHSEGKIIWDKKGAAKDYKNLCVKEEV